MAAIRTLPLPHRIGRPRGGWLVIAAAGALVVGVAGAQVDQVQRLVDTGYRIERLEAERAEKRAANHELEAEVARLSSLARVEWEARVRLGMGPARTRFYIEVNHPLPARQTLPTRFLPPAPAQQQDDDRTVWERLGRLLPF